MPRRLLPLAVLLVVLVAACDDAGGGEPIVVSVNAEIVEAGVPAAVEVTEPVAAGSAVLEHRVNVEWQGDDAARLDDARFAQHVPGGDGDLIVTGRGCGAQWDEDLEQLLLACTDDLQIITPEPGEVHEYPVEVHTEVGPLALAPGTYVIDEPIAWWENADLDALGTDADGVFTVRLTYEVR